MPLVVRLGTLFIRGLPVCLNQGAYTYIGGKTMGGEITIVTYFDEEIIIFITTEMTPFSTHVAELRSFTGHVTISLWYITVTSVVRCLFVRCFGWITRRSP